MCELLHREANYLVLRYRLKSTATINGIPIKQGSTTIAHYWKNRNYSLWKFKGPDSTLLGYLFHICHVPEIGDDYLRSVDLELDIWCDPNGCTSVLDQDVVNDYYRRGIFDDKTFSLIADQKMEILTCYKTIIHDLWSEETLS